jgi:hypothetical protein
MVHHVSLSDEELAELDRMLTKELVERRSELRRTRNPSFRAQLDERIEVLEHMHEQVSEELAHHAVPAG